MRFIGGLTILLWALHFLGYIQLSMWSLLFLSLVAIIDESTGHNFYFNFGEEEEEK